MSYIKNKAGETFGPIHWKHILEWNEMDLLSGFTSKGDDIPIADLVSDWKVPPTISINALMLAPTDSDKPCSEAELKALLKLGFPKIESPVSSELAAHLKKRMQMSADALNAEDPQTPAPSGVTQTTTSPKETTEAEPSKPEVEAPITEELQAETIETAPSKPEVETPKAPEETIAATPVSPEPLESEPSEPEAVSPEPLETEVETPLASEEAIPATPISSEPLKTETPPPAEPKPVTADIQSEPSTTSPADTQKPKRFGLIIAVAALLLVGIGIWLVLKKDTQPEVTTQPETVAQPMAESPQPSDTASMELDSQKLESLLSDTAQALETKPVAEAPEIQPVDEILVNSITAESQSLETAEAPVITEQSAPSTELSEVEMNTTPSDPETAAAMPAPLEAELAENTPTEAGSDLEMDPVSASTPSSETAAVPEASAPTEELEVEVSQPDVAPVEPVVEAPAETAVSEPTPETPEAPAPSTPKPQTKENSEPKESASEFPDYVPSF